MRLRHGLVVALLLIWPCVATAGDSYYMAVFGCQNPKWNRPRDSHSFAVFLRYYVRPDGYCWYEQFTISWLPESGQIQPLRLSAVPGENLSLNGSFDLVLKRGDRVSMWGPYQIEKELYQRARAQKARLESGQVAYKALDGLHSVQRVTNCMDALMVLATEGERRVVGWGEMASYAITVALTPWIIDPERTHDWVINALGIEYYPIVRRDLEDGNPSGLSLRDYR
jgi:hypothetical protein